MLTSLLSWQKYWEFQIGRDGVVVSFMCQLGQAIILSYKSNTNLDVAVHGVISPPTNSWYSVDEITFWNVGGPHQIRWKVVRSKNQSCLEKKKFCLKSAAWVSSLLACPTDFGLVGPHDRSSQILEINHMCDHKYIYISQCFLEHIYVCV